ncbi:hypothetical protein ACLK1Z_02710 [Escherichia coli]
MARALLVNAEILILDDAL